MVHISYVYLIIPSQGYYIYRFFADDQILLAKSEDDLQRSVHKIQPILTKYNMKISKTKTKATEMNGKKNS